MKAKKLWHLAITTLVLWGCKTSYGPNTSSSSLGSISLGKLPAGTVEQRSILRVTEQGTSSGKSYPLSKAEDITLSPGRYDFALSLHDGKRAFAGTVKNATQCAPQNKAIKPGENKLTMVVCLLDENGKPTGKSTTTGGSSKLDLDILVADEQDDNSSYQKLADGEPYKSMLSALEDIYDDNNNTAKFEDLAKFYSEGKKIQFKITTYYPRGNNLNSLKELIVSGVNVGTAYIRCKHIEYPGPFPIHNELIEVKATVTKEGLTREFADDNANKPNPIMELNLTCERI